MSVAAAPSTAATTAAPLLTYESYLAGPRIEGKYDIIDGKVIFDVSGASFPHQDVTGNIYVLLRAFQQATRIGRVYIAPCDVLINRFPFRVRQPDVFFISNERLEEAGGIPEEGPLDAAPEIIVEVLSPSETPRSIREKLDDYRRIGVREAWLVSRSAETVQVLRLDGEAIETIAAYAYDQTLTSLSFPELTLAVAGIFAE